jgi:AraC-like DNA-binding protein
MKPLHLTIKARSSQSFSARCDVQPDINNRLHYHDEYELIYFKKGGGTQFIGDSIETFEAGDVVLLGSNLPHFWQYHPLYFTDQTGYPVEVYVVHFSKHFWGDTFLTIPENLSIARALDRSGRGLQLKGNAAEKVASVVEKIIVADGFDRLLYLMTALQEISLSPNIKPLASAGFKSVFNKKEQSRLQVVYSYTVNNYQHKTNIDAIAKVANISPNSFCRFFKSHTGKTYSAFVNEIRVGHARRLLIERTLNLKTICFECGFKNAVSFYRAFKDVTGFTPVVYQKTYSTS